MRPNDLKIDPVTAADLEDWLMLALKLWPPDAAIFDSEKQALEKILLSILDSDREAGFVTRQQDGKAIAFMNLSLRYEYVPGGNKPPVAYVEGIFVESAYRHCGVGKALIAKAKSWAVAQGCTQLASDALIENEASHLFHAAMGFEEVERVVCFIQSVD